MRDVVPENRKRVYAVRDAIEILADEGTTLELRPTFGRSIVTVLARIEGRTIGVMANDPAHLGGAIDSDSADKGARFLQLCDAYGIPIVSLCDTPGFMVGPEAEETAQVRHFGRMFVAGASLSVPIVTVVLRKAVGLGAMAMSAGSFHATVAPGLATGEVSGTVSRAVRTSRRELESITDPAEEAPCEGRGPDGANSAALNAAAHELDDVIDPADTRQSLSTSCCAATPTTGNRPMVDTGTAAWCCSSWWLLVIERPRTPPPTLGCLLLSVFSSGGFGLAYPVKVGVLGVGAAGGETASGEATTVVVVAGVVVVVVCSGGSSATVVVVGVTVVVVVGATVVVVVVGAGSSTLTTRSSPRVKMTS